MIITLKYIFGNVPKLFRWLIGTIFIAPILIYVVVQFSINKPIELFPTNLIYLFLSILFFVITSYFVGAFISVGKLLNEKNLIEKNTVANPKTSKKMLPYSDITIGNYKTQDISVDIRAKIILGELNKPSVDIFLDRVKKGDPFCPQCSRPMDYWKLSWMANFAQIGYQCLNCKIQHKGDYEDVFNDIKGEVRKNYDSYWLIYMNEIDKLIKGKPEDFQLPK